MKAEDLRWAESCVIFNKNPKLEQREVLNRIGLSCHTRRRARILAAYVTGYEKAEWGPLQITFNS
jgi:hypothetical protein